MMRRLLLSLACALPAWAAAQQIAITADEVNLRAGPDSAYPPVALLPPNSQVIVQGCLPEYTWCDVRYGPDRGWVYGGALRYPYQNGYAALPQVAPFAGIATFGFIFDDYWGANYRNRPWYRDRDVWARPAPPPPRRPPPRDHGNGRDRPHAVPPPASPPPLGLPPPARGNSGWDPSQLNAPRPDRP